MTFEDYKNAVERDAVDAIERGEYDYCSDVDQVIDNMWIDDSITGNGSGSYTFSTYEAKKLTQELIWDTEFLTECEDLGITILSLFEKGAETVDVAARCLALGYAHDAITETWEERNESIKHDIANVDELHDLVSFDTIESLVSVAV